MEEEKRDDRSRYPFKMFLEEALVRQRNEMMEKFFQILQRLPMTATEAYSTSNHFASVTPFKVQVNFDIPLFEGQIDAYALEKWLNLLEGYYSVCNDPKPLCKDHHVFGCLLKLFLVVVFHQTLCLQLHLGFY
jgi:hypothetical protein